MNIGTVFSAHNNSTNRIVLNFTINDDAYSIETRHIAKVIRIQEVVVLPQIFSVAKGMLHHQGVAIPLASMRFLLGAPEAGYTEQTCIIVIQNGEKCFGLIVDAVRNTTALSPGGVMPLTRPSRDIYIPIIAGTVTLSNNTTAWLLDVRKLHDIFITLSRL